MKNIYLVLLILLPFTGICQHTITLKSGEKMAGEVQSIKDGILSFAFKGNPMTFKIVEVSSIVFDQSAGTETKPAASNTTLSGTNGVSFLMNGRKMTKQPTISNLTMEKGIVVVDVTINKYGNVIKAEPGAEGTTTTSQYLLTKGKQAAESAQFDTGPTMPLQQKGAITIIF